MDQGYLSNIKISIGSEKCKTFKFLMCLVFVLKRIRRWSIAKDKWQRGKGEMGQLENKLISRGSNRTTGILLVTGYRTTTRCSVETLDVFIPLPKPSPPPRNTEPFIFTLFCSLPHGSPQTIYYVSRGGSKQLYFAPKLKYISLISCFQIRVWPICNRIYSHLL